MITLDLAIAISEGCYGRIAGWSGLAKQQGIIVHDGTIDSDYLSEVCMVLFNLFNQEYTAKSNSRVAQLIIDRYFTQKFVSFNEFAKKYTGRGDKGVGSSGGF